MEHQEVMYMRAQQFTVEVVHATDSDSCDKHVETIHVFPIYKYQNIGYPFIYYQPRRLEGSNVFLD